MELREDAGAQTVQLRGAGGSPSARGSAGLRWIGGC